MVLGQGTRTGLSFHRLFLPIAIAISVCLRAPFIRAAPRDITGTVNCPVLGPELAAELKARALADLSLRSTSGGEFDVLCEEWRSRVSFRLRAGATGERVVTEMAEPRALVDALLVALGEAAALAAAHSADVVEGERLPAVAAEVSSNSPLSQSVQNGILAADPARPRERPEPAADSGHASPSFRPNVIAAMFGAGGELLGGDPAAGARIGLAIGWPSGIWVSVAADYAQALAVGRVATLREIGGTMVMSAWLAGGTFEFGTGDSAGAALLSAPGYFPSQQASTLLAAVLRTRYAFTIQDVRFAVGPELRFHAFPTSVAVNGVPEDSVPWLTPSIELEFLARFDGRPW
jgi:hypothetical protein